MSPNAQTRGQMAARYNRLKKRVEFVKFSDNASKALIEVAKTTLNIFPVTDTTPASTVSIPSWEEVESLMKSLMPSPSETYHNDFLRTHFSLW